MKYRDNNYYIVNFNKNKKIKTKYLEMNLENLFHLFESYNYVLLQNLGFNMSSSISSPLLLPYNPQIKILENKNIKITLTNKDGKDNYEIIFKTFDIQEKNDRENFKDFISDIIVNNFNINITDLINIDIREGSIIFEFLYNHDSYLDLHRSQSLNQNLNQLQLPLAPARTPSPAPARTPAPARIRSSLNSSS